METAPGAFLLGTSWLVIFPNDKHDKNNKGNDSRNDEYENGRKRYYVHGSHDSA
jgi:hypothetical protein